MTAISKQIDTHYRASFNKLSKFFGEDATQQAYLELLEWAAERKQVDEIAEEAINYHIWRGAKNARTRMDYEDRRYGTSIDEVPESNLIDDARLPDDQLLYKEWLVRIMNMHEPDRYIIFMYFVMGYNVQQIAKMGQVSRQTARTCLKNFSKQLERDE